MATKRYWLLVKANGNARLMTYAPTAIATGDSAKMSPDEMCFVLDIEVGGSWGLLPGSATERLKVEVPEAKPKVDVRRAVREKNHIEDDEHNFLDYPARDKR